MWDPRARRKPAVIALKGQAELVVQNAKVAVAAANDGVRCDRLHLLCHHADVRLSLVIVGEAIVAETVVEAAEQMDVVLQPDIGTPAPAAEEAPATATETTATTAEATAQAATETTAHAAGASEAADTLGSTEAAAPVHGGPASTGTTAGCTAAGS